MNKEQIIKKENSIGDDDINFKDLLKTIWRSRKLVFKFVLSFFLIGIFIAIVSPKEYTASSTFIPQTETGSGGARLGGLASLAGIDLGGSSSFSEIPPSLYPKIVKSIEFKRALLNTPITVEKENKTNYREYYEEIHSPGILSTLIKYTFGLPGVIIRSFSTEVEEDVLIDSKKKQSVRLIYVSDAEVGHFKRLDDQIIVVPDNKEGTVELKFTMPEPLMAAEMAKTAEELLQEEVISYKIQNAREQLKFAQAQFEEKRADFVQKQQELAQFRDRNRNITSAVARNEIEQLEAEYNFALNIFTEMAKQLEQAKLRVSKDTPVFSVIHPVSVPSSKSAPNRLFIIFNFIVLGFVLALGYIFSVKYYQELKEKW